MVGRIPKSVYGAVEDDTEWQLGTSSTEVYWCLATMEAFGPDDGYAHATTDSSPDATPDSRADAGPDPHADPDPRANVHHPDPAAAPDLPPLTTNATTQRPAYHPGR